MDQSHAPTPAESGFTLLELSIVLVIIALIAGGILAGKELIHIATLRSQIKQVEQFTLAYNLFKGKYKCIPGDCANANDFFSGADNGNGNEKLENSYIYLGSLDDSTDGNFDLEQSEFFEQLKDAELISTDYSTVQRGYPAVSLSPLQGFTAASTFNPEAMLPPYNNSYTPQSKTYFGQGMWKIGLYFAVGDPDAPWGWQNDTHGIFTPMDTYYMDLKMDDGNPQTGKFLGGTITWTNYNDGDDGYCLDNTPHANNIYTNVAAAFPNAKWETYLLTNPKKPCIFAWKLE